MRKSLCRLLCCLMVFCCTCSMCVPSASANTLGDVNGDGSINASDALLVLQHSVALISLSSESITAGNVNEDGNLNASDALLILQYSVGLVIDFRYPPLSLTATSVTLSPGGTAVIFVKQSTSDELVLFCNDYVNANWMTDKALSDGGIPLFISANNYDGISTKVTLYYKQNPNVHYDITVNISSSASDMYWNNLYVPDFGALTNTAAWYCGVSELTDGSLSYYLAYNIGDIATNYGSDSPIIPYITLAEQNGFYDAPPSFEHEGLWYRKDIPGGYITLIFDVVDHDVTVHFDSGFFY